jgi:uncharacterized hydrophobic protein (TIGR00271 family)
MRLIQQDAMRQTLDEMAIECLFTDADGTRDGAVAYVPVPTGAVDAVLEQLYEAGLDDDADTVVTDVHHASVPNVDDLTDRYVEGPTGDRGVSNPELRKRARGLKPDTATYVAFAALSAIVAVGGLLLNSAIVIVGAMVIAPFAGSTLSASVGAVVSDRQMVLDSATSQLLGLAVAFAAAIGMSALLVRTGFVPAGLVVSRLEQVSAFLTPNILTLVIAIAAGAAGALALATDLPVSIAGVAVAAAIVPAAATAGIGVVWRQPLLVLGAAVLLVMNIVFINLAAYVTLVSLGYRSTVLRTVQANVSLSIRTGAYTVLVVAFVVLVALTTIGTVQHLGYERSVNEAVQTELRETSYRSLELVGVGTQYNDVNLLGANETVTVTVSRSSDAEYDRLDERLQRRISAATGRPVTVTVRFVDYQIARPSDPATGPPSPDDGLVGWVSRVGL